MPDWQGILAGTGPRPGGRPIGITGNRADADECLQEAFLGALESAHGHESGLGCPAPRLATALAVDRVRERRRGPGEHVADRDASGPRRAGSRELDEAELAERLRSAPARISPRQAEVFCLHCLEGNRDEEISRRLAVSVAAVGVHLHRHARSTARVAFQLPQIRSWSRRKGPAGHRAIHGDLHAADVTADKWPQQTGPPPRAG